MAKDSCHHWRLDWFVENVSFTVLLCSPPGTKSTRKMKKIKSKLMNKVTFHPMLMIAESIIMALVKTRGAKLVFTL